MTFVNIQPPSPHLLQLLAAHPLLSGLPDPMLQSLCTHAQTNHLLPGEVLFHEGDPAWHWYIVHTGQIELIRFCCEGNERVFHRFGAGQCIAEVAMFMAHRRYPMQAQASEPTTVWRLERQALQKACAEHPPLALRLLENFSHRLYHYINEVEWMTVSSAPQRLAAYLLRLSERQGTQLELPSSQRQLAATLGIRPETLSRLLTQWQHRQWLQGERRHWTLLNQAPLHQLAGPLARAF